MQWCVWWSPERGDGEKDSRKMFLHSPPLLGERGDGGVLGRVVVMRETPPAPVGDKYRGWVADNMQTVAVQPHASGLE